MTEPNPIEEFKQGIRRMRRALRAIGYSAHSGSPRLGPKAQVARWGLGEDACPHERRVEVGLDRWKCALCGEVET